MTEKEYYDNRKITFMNDIAQIIKGCLPDDFATFPDFDLVAVNMFEKLLEVKPEAFKSLAIETVMEQVDNARVRMMNNGTLDVLVDGDGNISLARIERDEG